MQMLSFKLTDFEGPLDLLLFLISKHKLNILDIEISELLRQYLSAIEQSGQQDLSTASEFLEMAARLVNIKSLSLLPKHADEADKLKQQLTGELMEYQLCKALAARLSALAKDNLVYVRPPMPIELDLRYPLKHPPTLLFSATKLSMGRVVRKRPVEQKSFEALVARRVVSVNGKIIHLMRRFYKSPTASFDSLFENGGGRSDLVATFLAVLELMKGKRLTISEDGKTVTFHKTKRSEVKEA